MASETRARLSPDSSLLHRVFGKILSTKDQVSNAFSSNKMTAARLVGMSSSVLSSLASTLLTMVLVLAVSVFMYGTFYYAYMPLELQDLPLHFQFKPCEDSMKKCSNPAAIIGLDHRKQNLLQGQPYTFSMTMEIPDTPSNEDHGMFMSCLNITTTTGDLVDRACKSSLSQYRSPLLRTMETLFFSPALLTGFSSQSQLLTIDYFTNFQTNPHIPAQILAVELQSRHLTITSARLHVAATLSGLRHVMYRHPWIAAFIGISLNIFLLSTVIAMSWASFNKEHKKLEGQMDNEEIMDEEVEESNEDVNNEPEPEIPTPEQSSEEVVIERVSLSQDSGSGPSTNAPEMPVSAPAPSIGSRLRSFILRLLFKLIFKSISALLLAAIAIGCYEWFYLGKEDYVELMEAVKEDGIFLFKFLVEKTVAFTLYIKKVYAQY